MMVIALEALAPRLTVFPIFAHSSTGPRGGGSLSPGVIREQHQSGALAWRAEGWPPGKIVLIPDNARWAERSAEGSLFYARPYDQPREPRRCVICFQTSRRDIH